MPIYPPFPISPDAPRQQRADPSFGASLLREHGPVHDRWATVGSNVSDGLRNGMLFAIADGRFKIEPDPQPGTAYPSEGPAKRSVTGDFLARRYRMEYPSGTYVGDQRDTHRGF